MKRIALTGGIASGKSTVANLIAETGTPIADADALCRQVMAPGTPLTREIARRWPDAMKPGGVEIDRRALGRIVFADESARREEEALVLPAIQSAFEAWARERERGGCRLCVYDAALIFEHGLESSFDGVLLVAAPREVQLRRLKARDGLSEREAIQRLDAQMSLEEKRRRATWVIDNDGSLARLREKFRRVWGEIQLESGFSGKSLTHLGEEAGRLQADRK